MPSRRDPCIIGDTRRHLDMVKSLKSNGMKKEKSWEKRKRRENITKARENARRYVFPLLAVLLVLLAVFLYLRFGLFGKKLTEEERTRIRSQRQFAKLMRDYGGDFSKLKDVMGGAGGTGNNKAASASEQPQFAFKDTAQEEKKPQEPTVEDEVFVE